MESSMSFLAILANVLKPAPGNHSGTYLTAEANSVRPFANSYLYRNSYGWERHPRETFQAAGQDQ